MSRKRGRDDEYFEHARAPVKFEEVTKALLRIVSVWRDACDSEYDVRARVETRDDASILRIGTFDELACIRIVSVLDAALPGDYTITESQCDMTKKGLVLIIRRSWSLRKNGDAAAPNGGARKEARVDGGGNNEGALQETTAPQPQQAPSGVSGEFVRLRVSNIIGDKNDAENVTAAMNAVMKYLPRGASWTVATTPACHVVSFKLTEPKLDTAAVRAACVASAGVGGTGGAGSAVDFERGVLRVAVPKAHPDIV